MSKIIVPTDFTPVSNSAIQYACEIGKATKSDIHLLHIVKSKGDLDDANLKMNAQAAQHKEKRGFDLKSISRVGNIFDDIPHVAQEEGADLIVMGTHGLQGMQFIVGSHALRIVSESKVPLIIVQDGAQKNTKVSRILLPLDLHQETKQKLKIAADVALRFGAEIHLISPKENDEFLHNRLARNISYAEGYLDERKVKYKTQITDASSGAFVKDLLKYAKYAEIDLICILNTAEERIVHAFGMDSEQKIITNEASIPVMIFNPALTYKDAASVFAQ